MMSDSPSQFSPRMIKSEESAAVLQIVKLSDQATIPVRGSDGAAGYDLFSAETIEIPARGKGLVKTDIQIKVPRGTYGRIAPRSGLSWRHHIDIGAGVVDRDFRGNVKIVMFNHADVEFKVRKGDKIAQLICEKIVCPDIEVLPVLDQTARGESGFGSTN